VPRRLRRCLGCGATWVPHDGNYTVGLPARVADRHALMSLPSIGVQLIAGFAENC
jgi:hypothetical protein